jgi:putative endonuclease
VTNDLARRVWEHKQGKIQGFTKEHKCKKLVYQEFYQYANNAIKREKEIKGWKREKKQELIRKQNPHW